jgi:hypothetical protein
MSGLAKADLLEICDSIAQQAVNVKAGFDANATGYTNNRGTILSAQTADDLSAGVDLSAAFEVDVPVLIAHLLEARRQALEAHMGGLNAYLLAQDARIAEALRTILGWPLNAPSVFPPVMSGASKLGSFKLSGAGAGTFTNGAALNKVLYGHMWLRAKVITQNISAEVVATIIGTKYAGTAQSKQVTLTIGATPGTYFEIGTLGTLADNFDDVTNVTVTGGGANDEFEIESKLERVISL